MNQRQGKAFGWLLVIVLPAFVVYPALLYPIEEHSYDAATFHIYRGVLFSAARAEGVAYPRWVQPINLGLGGPLFSFYSPLTYFGMDGLHALGVSHPVAWRVLVAVALLVASTGAFALVLSLTRDAWGAIAGAALYVYSFPLLREFLERGSPEGFAYALYPWVLYSLVRFLERPGGFGLAFASFALAAAILTHNLSAFLLIPLLAVVAVLFVPRLGWRVLAATALVLLCGLVLAGVFTLPFAAEARYVKLANAITVDYTRIAENPTPLRELLALPHAYDVGLGNNQIGDHLGPVLSLVLVAGLLGAPVLWIRRRRWEMWIVVAFALCSLTVVWLLTASASPVWKGIPLLGFVQARTRLLGLCIVSLAVVAGVLVSQLARAPRSLLAAALVVSSLLLAFPVLYPDLQYRYAVFEQEPTVEDARAFVASENISLTAFNEFVPIWRHLPFTASEAHEVQANLIANLPEGGRLLHQEYGVTWVRARFESPVVFDATLRILYFPGLKAHVDDQARSLEPVEGTGYALLRGMPEGNHTVELRYVGTAWQRLGAVASVVSALLLCLGAVLWRDRGGSARPATYPALSGWLIATVVLLVGFKALYLDRHTTLFRNSSECSSVQGATVTTAVRFGSNLRLCAVDLPRQAFRPGETLRVTLYWQAERVESEPTNSFVHLLGEQFNPRTGNPLWGQQDKQQPGTHPVTRWVPGKIYRDSYEFDIDPGTPPGEYQLEIGWVEPSTGQRLEPEMLQQTEGLSVSHLDSLLISGLVVR